MRPGKILLGQVLIVFLLIVLTIWGATQWTAHMFGYQPALGRPWFFVSEIAVYKPWRLFQWWYAYEAYAPDVFARAGLIASSGGLLGIFAAVIGSVVRSQDAANVTTYGSARWAKASDLKRHGLMDRDGVFLGKWNSDYLRHNGPEHVMAFAPTRSGKGVGLVVPTLLSWTGSAVIHDIKGENWDLTSGWRSRFSTCLRFDPTDTRSPKYNPLLEVRRGLQEVRDVQNIADILVDPEGSLERRNHWEKTAHALLVGVMLHVLYAEDEKTLAGCGQFLSDPSRSFTATLTRMMRTQHLGGDQVHPVVAQAARELLNKSENERSGVLSTALSFLSLYRDPVIADITSASDWRLADLTDDDKPVSLYLACPPSDMSRTKPLMRLILNQIGRRLTEELPKPGRRKLLMMLDEFPALGRLDFFETALAFMAGYGVRAFLIAQSLNQIEKAYGPNHSILDNCHVRVAFATNDERTAKRISDALGAKTELRAQKNYTGHRLAPWLSHMMVSRQETQRPLLTPGEVMQLPASDEIVMVSGAPPVRATKLRYYKDRNFTQRVLPPSSVAVSASKRPDDWSGLAIGADTDPEKPDGSGSSGAGSLEIAPELAAQPETTPPVPEPDVLIAEDETLDVAEAQHLETIRRAATLDLTNPDTLPDF
ncbi:MULTISPECIES: conjugal transfer protein TraG [unclassified Hyphomonas]|uniref:conjugal transfer protein TraG n=6 Tax=Hyphomonas TaxID=85 RepID=UPI000C91459D|nr:MULTISPECIES: conjugal transfer protein TraG [unclassified Hyphomonas]MAL46540.1 conjugal transfer protein TraG [Hyphomonas sp.]HAW56118.1 conjugal transfer protein TraG [Hyphomonas sp.]HBJ39844.1 conjugal transfer protein TraG [Hyphomonas sp.]HCJ19776.1 conjugal transfer protein TraG [Hyphomonas sp.]